VLTPPHTRLLATTLGRVEVSQIAYRAPAVSNLHPADARLALPDGGYSFPLQKGAQQRDPQHQRRWIVLVDGNNHQIDRIHAEAPTHRVKVDIIVDFVHILEYLWKAAEDLHPTQPGRAGFVAHTARDLLEHHPARVIADLNIHHDALTQTGTTAPGLKRCIDYLTAKQPYLIYRIALTMGWPIATGVIEGACRYLVKDRMAITGARWGLPGAEAVLRLR
jgi:hypothetical protein